MQKTWLSLVALTLGAALSLGACGDDDDDTQSPGGSGGKGGSGGSSGMNGSSGAGGSGMGAGGSSGAGGSAGTGGGSGQGGSGGGAGTGGQGGQAPTSFTEVLAAFSVSSATRGCLNAGCHGPGTDPPPGGGLVITYDNLRNGTASITTCDLYSTKYVETADVEKSLLLAKIDPGLVLPTDLCSDRMPLGSEGADAELIALVRKWITEGANP